PVAPESLRERVLEGAPAPRRRRSRRRRLFLVVGLLALVRAVDPAVVHGFVNSGSNSQSLEPALKEARLSPSAANAFKRKSVQHGTAVTTGENAYSTGYSADQNALKSLAAPTGARDLVTIPRNRLVHATASLEVQVTNRSDL